MKIGDYVRTINGKIYRVLDNDLGDYIRVENEYNGTYKIDISNTTKSSPNIIDLIEVGDYVNGGRVELVEYKRILVALPDYEECQTLTNKDIKSIVTHEQLERIEYKIEE